MFKEKTIAIIAVAVIAVAALIMLPKDSALSIVIPIVTGILAFTNPSK